MAANKCYIGDIGTEILVDCKCDITGATDTVFKVKKPNGDLVIWIAEIEGTNFLKYDTSSGDFDQIGKHYLQASLAINGWSGLGETDNFRVYDLYK